MHITQETGHRFGRRAVRRVFSMLLALNMLLSPMASALGDVAWAEVADDALAIESKVAEVGDFELVGEFIDQTYTYDFAGGQGVTVLSIMLDELGMPFGLKQVVDVRLTQDQENAIDQLVRIDYADLKRNGEYVREYVITALKDFEELALLVYVENEWDPYTIRMTNVVSQIVDDHVDEEQLHELTENGAAGASEGLTGEGAPTYTFQLGDAEAALSAILSSVDLSIDMQAIVTVGLADSEEDYAPVNIVRVEGDYLISAAEPFTSVELAVCTADEVYAIQLMDGWVSAPARTPSPESTEAPAEAPTEAPTREPAKDPDGDEELAEDLDEDFVPEIIEDVTAAPVDVADKDYPAQSFDGGVGQLRVKAVAGEGAFPEGTTMRVGAVTDDARLSRIANAVADDFVEVRRVVAADISFYDEDGFEIEPRIPVTLTLSMDQLEKSLVSQEVLVVHLDDEGRTQVLKQVREAERKNGGSDLNVTVSTPVELEIMTGPNGSAPVGQGEGASSDEVEAEPVDGEPEVMGTFQLTGEPASTSADTNGGQSETDPEALRDTGLTFETDGFSVYGIVFAEVISTRYIDANGDTWAIEVAYGKDAGIPAGAELKVAEVTGAMGEDYAANAAQALKIADDDVRYTKALDISIYYNGEKIQPMAPVDVSIKLLDADLTEPSEVGVVHFDDEKKAQVIDCAMNGEAVEFETKGFSVYVVVQTIVRHVLENGDEENFLVTVQFDKDSGIPANAQLEVTELSEGTVEYDNYVAKAAETLGTEVKRLAFAHAFDISLVDPATGEHYQPTRDVKVSIDLLKEDIKEGDDVSVVHFPGTYTENPSGIDGESGGKRGTNTENLPEGEILAANVNGEAVEFESSGFSVYIVTRRDITRTYTFMNGNDIYSRQVLKNGEKLVEPLSPVKPGVVFSHWSTTEGGEAFTNFGPVTVTAADHDPVTFYAVYGDQYVIVTYYDQAGAVAQREKVMRPTGQNTATVDTTQVDYIPMQTRDDVYLKFRFWVQGLAELAKATPTQAGNQGVITIDANSKDIDLYPIVAEGHWMMFDSNKAGADGNSVTYAAPLFVVNGERLGTDVEVIKDRNVSSSGYVFDGWYTRRSGGERVFKPVWVNSSNQQVDEGTEGAVRALVVDTDEDGLSSLVDENGDLGMDPTVYAHWTKSKTTYSVAYYIQDAGDSPNGQKHYDFWKDAGSWEADTGATVSLNDYIAAKQSEDANFDLISDAFNADTSNTWESDRLGFEVNADSYASIEVKGDKSSSIAVKFDRKVFTLEFYKLNSNKKPSSIYSDNKRYDWNSYYGVYYRNNNDYIPLATAWQYNFATTDAEVKQHIFYKSITELYGHPVSSYFPLDPNNDSMSYKDPDSSTYGTLFAAMDLMPPRNDVFKASGTGNGSKINLYYTEMVDGAAAPSGSFRFNNVDYPNYKEEDGIRFELNRHVAHSFHYITDDEEFFNIEGFTKYKADPDIKARNYGTDANPIWGTVYDSPGPFYLYYRRHTWDLTVKNNVNSRTKVWENVKYGQPISAQQMEAYKFNIDNAYALKDENKQRRHYEDGSLIWWYYDAACTQPVDFNTFVMPDHPLTLYEGVSVEYLVKIEPNGGELFGENGDKNNYSSWFYLKEGEQVGEYGNIARDYVKARAGETPTHWYDQHPYTDAEENDRTFVYRDTNVDGQTKQYVYRPGRYMLTGWYEVVNGKPKASPYNFTTKLNHSLTLRAGWRRTSNYTVVYNAGAGIRAPIDGREYVEGARAVVLASVASEPNKRFVGWKDAKGVVHKPNELLDVEEDIAVEQDDGSMMITLTAQYADSDLHDYYMADYDFMVGNELYYTQTIAKGETLVQPDPPTSTNTNEVFVGWYLDSEGKTRFEGFGVVNYPVYTTLYAHFEQVYTVSYYMAGANGGKGDAVISTQTYKPNDYLNTLYIDYPVDEDHEVERWRDADNNTYPYKAVSDTIQVTKNLDLWPVLVEHKLLNFDLQGGVTADGSKYMDSVRIPSQGWPAMPKEPTRAGYSFQGWFTQPKGQGVEYKFNMSLKKFKTDNALTSDVQMLYAFWEMDTAHPVPSTLNILWYAQLPDGGSTEESYELANAKTVNFNLGEYTLDAATITALGKALGGSSADANYIKNTDRLEFLYYTGTTPSDSEPGRYKYDNMQYYFVWSNTKNSGTQFVVDDSGNSTLKVYFDRKQYRLRFDVANGRFFNGNNGGKEAVQNYPNYNNRIEYGGNNYTGDSYTTMVWLEKDVFNEWPKWFENETVSDDYANVIWNPAKSNNPSGHQFNGWRFKKTPTSNELWSIFTAVYTISSAYIGYFKDSGTMGSDGIIETTMYAATRTGLSQYTLQYWFDGLHNVLFDQTMNVKVSSSEIITDGGHQFYKDFNAKTFEGYEVIYDSNQDEYCYKDGNSYRGMIKQPSANPGTTTTEEYTVYHYYIADKWKNITFYGTLTSSYEGFWPWGREVTVASNPISIVRNEDGDTTLNLKPGTYEAGVTYTPTLNDYKIYKGSNGPQMTTGSVYYKDDEKNEFVEVSWTKLTTEVIQVKTATALRTSSQTHPTINFYYQRRTYPVILMSYDGVTVLGTFHELYQEQMSGESGKLETDAYKAKQPSTGNADYEFACWSQAPNSPNRPFEGTMPAHNLTLYACKRLKDVKVTTVGCKADGTPTENKTEYFYKYKPVHTLLREFELPQPTNDEGTFVGWHLAQYDSATQTYTLTDTAISVNDPITADTAIWAKFEKTDKARVVYNRNGGDENSALLPVDPNVYIFGAKIDVKPGDGMTKKMTDVTGAEYDAEFVCWNTQQDGSGINYYRDDKLSIGPTDGVLENHIRTVTLYAQYNERRETTLIYDANGGRLLATDSAQDDAFREKLQITDPHQKILQYQVTFLDDSQQRAAGYVGHPNTLITIGYTDGKDTGIPFQAARSGFSFAGWSTDQNADTPMALNGDSAYINTLLQGGNVLYAVWIRQTYRVQITDGSELLYYMNGGDYQEAQFRTLDGAYNALDHLYKKVGDTYVKFDPTDSANNAHIEMTVSEYEMEDGDDVTWQPTNPTKSYYMTLTTASGVSTCTMKHGAVSGQMLNLGRTDMTLTNITLDGESKGGEEGGIVKLTQNSSKLTLGSGATLQNGTATGSGLSSNPKGGAVYMLNGECTIEDGAAIKNCSAEEGGAVYIAAGGKFSMEGGEITGCTATDRGGALAINGEAAVSGGSITGNRSANGGAVDFDTQALNTLGRLKLSGDPVIYDNTDASGKQRNVDITHASTLTVNSKIQVADTLDSSAHVGVYAPNGHKEENEQFGEYTGSAQSSFSTFSNDQNPLLFGADGGSGSLVWHSAICKIVDTDSTGAEHPFPTLNRALQYMRANLARCRATDGSVSIEMLVDYSMPSGDKVTINAGENVILKTATTGTYRYDNKGGTATTATITRGYTGASMLTSSGTLGLSNIALNGASDTLSANTDGGLINISAGSLNLGSGTTLRDFKTTGNGGAVYLASGASAVINSGATIDGHSALTLNEDDDKNKQDAMNALPNATSGAAVYVNSGATLTMNGGTIAKCKSTGIGGAIYNAGTVTMSATNNPTVRYSFGSSGGGVYNAGTLNMNGGKIEFCMASAAGGAVYLTSSGTMNMTGGEIKGSESVNGGAVDFQNASSRLVLSGDVRIYNNPAGEGHQKNVYLNLPTNNVIRTGANGLGANAQVGVYVTGDQSDETSVYGRHGGVGDPFGTRASDANVNNLSNFINDINYLTAVKGNAQNQIVWANSQASYMKIENRCNKSYTFRVYVTNANGTVYTGAVIRRGNNSQKADSPTNGYYSYPIDTNKAEVLYFPNGVGLKCSVEIWDNNTKITSLTNSQMILSQHEMRLASDMDSNGRFTGSLVAGPEYHVVNDYANHKDDPVNCYNQAVINNQYRLLSIFEYQTFLKYDQATNGPLPNAKFEFYTDETLNTKVNVTGKTAAENGYVLSDSNGIVTITGGIALGTHVSDAGQTPNSSQYNTNRVYYIKETPPAVNSAGQATAYAYSGLYTMSIRSKQTDGSVIVEIKKTYDYAIAPDQATIGNRSYIRIMNRRAICKIEKDGQEYAFETLREALTWARANMKGTGADADKVTATIEMLDNYTIPASDSLTGEYAIGTNDNITITTASTTEGAYKSKVQTATLTRGYNGDSLFAVGGGALNLGNLTVDGNKNNSFTGGNGGLVSVTSGGLTVSDGATLQNSAATNGGAIYAVGTDADNKATLTIGTIKINDCSATTNGGAIYLGSYVTASESDLDINGHSTLALHKAGDTLNAEDLTSEQRTILNVTSGSVTLTDATADALNRAEAQGAAANAQKGGAIYVSANSSFTFHGGEIEKCKASQYGGAIYNAGTVTMEEDPEAQGTAHALIHGSMEYCSAANGGAIFNAAGGTVDMAGGYIEHCFATEKGGGIYTESTATQTIDSKIVGAVNMHSDGTHPGVINSCSATGDGGGIYLAAGELDMTGGEIEYCQAANGGGIYLAAGELVMDELESDTSLLRGTIEHCTATNDGGGIYVNTGAVMTMHGGGIEHCSATRNGGGIFNGGTFKMTNTNTASSSTGGAQPGVIDNCSAENGGGIYLGLAEDQNVVIEIYGGTIQNCKANNNGGAIYDKSKASIKLEGVTINGHTDGGLTATTKNAKQGGGIYLPQLDGDYDSSLTIEDCNLYNLTAEQGGAIFSNRISLDPVTGAPTGEAPETGCTINISGGEINGHTGNFASSTEPNAYNGGMLYLGNGAVNINGTNIYNCTVSGSGDVSNNFTAGSGGVIFNVGNGHPNNDGVSPTVEMIGVTIDGHYGDFKTNCANTPNANNGGAIFMKMAVLRLENCTLQNLTVKPGSSGGGKGAAIFGYTNSGGTTPTVATISGGRIENNTAKGADGGAINLVSGRTVNIGNNDAKSSTVSFEGNAVVYGNTNADDKQANVVLETDPNDDNNKVIQTTANGLGTGAHIGVYVAGSMTSGSETEPYASHGGANDPFGTWVSASNLHTFKNDRDTALFGISRTDSLIYWAKPVVKLTDKDGNLLYYKDGDAYKPAVFETFEAAIDNLGKLYTSGSSGEYTAYVPTDADHKANIEMLDDVQTSDQIALSQGYHLTLKTADKNASDGLSYQGEGTQATVKAWDGDTNHKPMFALTNGTQLEVSGVTIDGNSAGGRTTTGNNGGLFNLSGANAGGTGTSLSLNGGAVLQNNKGTDTLGGAVYLGNGTSLDMTNATITGCQAAKGGGVYMTGANASMTLGDGATISGNKLTTDTVADGGGVYIDGNGSISVGGSATIYGNTTMDTEVVMQEDAVDPDTGEPIIDPVTGETTTVTVTTILSGKTSNLRLKDSAPGDYITLTSNLTGTIGVCNAGEAGYQFGHSADSSLTGQQNFVDDVNGMVGKADGTKIIWAMEPICQVVVKNPDGTDRLIGQYAKWDTGVDEANKAVSADGVVRLQLLQNIDWSGAQQNININNNNTKLIIESAPERNQRFTLTATSKDNRLFYFNGQNEETIFQNIILDGGSQSGSGNMQSGLCRIGRIHHGNVTLSTDCVVQNSSASCNGGAFCVLVGTKLRMEENSIIQHCESGNKGGAVHVHGGGQFECAGQAIIQNCSGKKGGAIYSESTVDRGVVISENCKIINNTTENSGGAFFTDVAGATIVISGNAEVSGNHADKNGGAIYVGKKNAKVTIEGNAKMEHNTTGQSGAAVFANGDNAEIIIRGNALIQNNTSEDGTQDGYGAKARGGGAIFNLDALVKVSGSPTVRNNTTLNHTTNEYEERNVIVPKETKNGNVIYHLEVEDTITGGDIGIYCADEMQDVNCQSTVKKSDGTYHILEQFGITLNPKAVNVPGLHHLTNDRTVEALSGVSGVGTGTRLVGVPADGDKVVWYYVCQIVKNGEFKKVYGSLADAAADVNAFGDGDLEIQMLIPAFETTETATVNKTDGAKVTLTTNYGDVVTSHATDGPVSDFYDTTGTSGYSYMDFDGNVTRPATVYRGFNGDSVLAVTNGNLEITNIILDGHDTKIDANDNDTTWTNTTNGGIVAVNGGTLTFTETATLQNSTSSGNGGAVYVNGGTVNMGSGTISDSDAVNGGAIYVNSGTANVTGGSLSGNSATGDGGAISTAGGTTTVSGGSLSGNSAANGGAICAGGGTTTVSGGSITGNTATGKGGAVYVTAGNAVAIAGGTITGNSATNGGAVNVANATSDLNFSGNPIIYNNMAGAVQKNVVLDVDDNGVINATGLDNDALIGVYVTDDQFNNHGGFNDKFGSYTSDANLGAFMNDRNNLMGAAVTENENYICWQNSVCMLTDANNNILYKNVGTSSNPIYVPALYDDLSSAFGDAETTTTLYTNANGTTTAYSSTGAIKVQMLRDYAQDDSDVVSYSSDRPITLTTAPKNSDPDYPYQYRAADGATGGNATITRKSGSSGTSPMFTFSTGNTVTVENVIVDGNKDHTTNGGGAFKIDVKDNKPTIASFANMEIKNAQTTGNGGAIVLAGDGTATLSGCTIKDCSADGEGGAVYTTGTPTSIIVENCTFKDCHAKSGGALSVQAETLTVEDTQFEGCYASKDTNNDGGNGGAIYHTSGETLTLTNVTVTGPKNSEGNYITGATGNGGAVYTNATTTVTVSGSEFTGCVTSGDGGAIYQANTGATTTVTGTTISGCGTTGGNGGGIYANGATTTLSSATISGCTAANGYGGGVYLANGETTLTSAQITGNSAANGGGVYVARGATLNMNDPDHNSTVTGNTATGNGAGIYLAEGSTLNLAGTPNFGGTGTSSADGSDVTASINGPDGNATTATTNGNYKTTTLGEGKTNGQKAYTTPREDIFIAGYDNDNATSLVITGALNVVPGSIWVGASDDDHYKMLTQFAQFKDGVVGNLSADELEATYKAFRNAKDDATSECGGDYLTGQEGDSTNLIKWTGGFDFAFLKTTTADVLQDGATFTLYKANSAGTDILTDDSGNRVAYQQTVSGQSGKVDATATSGAKTLAEIKRDVNGNVGSVTISSAEGLVAFEKIPPATYFLVETASPTGVQTTTTSPMYKLVVGPKGLIAITKPDIDASGNSVWVDVTTTRFVKGTDNKFTVASTIPEGADTVEVYKIENGKYHKVILRKVDGDTSASLPNAVFQIFRTDMSEIKEVDYGYSTADQGYKSGANGIYFVGSLPEGKYYLKETVKPDGNYTLPTTWFILTVDANGATQNRISASAVPLSTN